MKSAPEFVVPLLGPFASRDNDAVWAYQYQPQVGLNHRTVVAPRGKVIGGTSSVRVAVSDL